MANDKIKLISNVGTITSGVAPTTENLLPGQAAFGKINEDGKYHFFGNTGEGGDQGKVVDIIVDTIDSTVHPDTLEQVLTAGKTTTLDIIFDASTGHTTIVGHEGVSISDGSETVSMKAGEGFKDNGASVLSANPNAVIDAAEQTQMRAAIDVFSKSEVQALVSSVYRTKGTIQSFETLIQSTMHGYTPEIGDVWNIKTAGGKDINDVDIKAGDNIAYVGPNATTDWDVLSGVVDLSDYYNKTDVDGIKTGLQSSIDSVQTATDNVKTIAESALDTANTASSAADVAVHTANTSNTTANQAVTTAQNAVKTAEDAVDTADDAVNIANGAVDTANTASTTANEAKTVSDDAKTAADNAVTSANNAVELANAAAESANNATATANEAKTTAEGAKTVADDVRADADAGNFDGFSPTISTKEIDGGTEITITHKDGTESTFNIMDGVTPAGFELFTPGESEETAVELPHVNNKNLIMTKSGFVKLKDIFINENINNIIPVLENDIISIHNNGNSCEIAALSNGSISFLDISIQNNGLNCCSQLINADFCNYLYAKSINFSNWTEKIIGRDGFPDYDSADYSNLANKIAVFNGNKIDVNSNLRYPVKRLVGPDYDLKDVKEIGPIKVVAGGTYSNPTIITKSGLYVVEAPAIGQTYVKLKKDNLSVIVSVPADGILSAGMNWSNEIKYNIFSSSSLDSLISKIDSLEHDFNILVNWFTPVVEGAAENKLISFTGEKDSEGLPVLKVIDKSELQ